MAKWPATKQEWIEAGYQVAVVVKDATTYGDFHRMDADDWRLEGAHIIPIDTAEGALEAHKERGGAAPCRSCFPGGAIAGGRAPAAPAGATPKGRKDGDG